MADLNVAVVGSGPSGLYAADALVKQSAKLDPPVTVQVDVTNTGKRAGDEVVQLYVQHVGSSVERPQQDLRGYRRISLAPGETRTVSFPLAAACTWATT